jgi:SOS-response transcriptional repressor LexA
MSDKTPVNEIPSTREQIFNYLIRYKKAHDGNSPTNRQIAAACHVSPSTVAHHLGRLERANRIRLSEDEYRNIEIVGAAWLPPADRSTAEEGQDSQDAHDETRPANRPARRV